MTFLPRKQTIFSIYYKNCLHKMLNMVFKRSLIFHFAIFVTHAAQITVGKIVIANSIPETVPTCKRICLKSEKLLTSLGIFPCSIWNRVVKFQQFVWYTEMQREKPIGKRQFSHLTKFLYLN